MLCCPRKQRTIFSNYSLDSAIARRSEIQFFLRCWRKSLKKNKRVHVRNLYFSNVWVSGGKKWSYLENFAHAINRWSQIRAHLAFTSLKIALDGCFPKKQTIFYFNNKTVKQGHQGHVSNFGHFCLTISPNNHLVASIKDTR